MRFWSLINFLTGRKCFRCVKLFESEDSEEDPHVSVESPKVFIKGVTAAFSPLMAHMYHRVPPPTGEQ
jgi:hypothetical protein